jgi:hypothetical protein
MGFNESSNELQKSLMLGISVAFSQKRTDISIGHLPAG